MKNNTLSTIVVALISIILTAILILIFTYSYKENEYGDRPTDGYGWFYEIKNTPMVYDENTHVIYYYISDAHRGYMSPYYNENGQLCRYIDGEIVPIE